MIDEGINDHISIEDDDGLSPDDPIHMIEESERESIRSYREFRDEAHNESLDNQDDEGEETSHFFGNADERVDQDSDNEQGETSHFFANLNERGTTFNALMVKSQDEYENDSSNESSIDSIESGSKTERRKKEKKKRSFPRKRRITFETYKRTCYACAIRGLPCS